MDGYPENKVADSRIGQYASLVRIRKKWALIGLVAVGICTMVSFAVLFGMAWELRDKAVTRLTMLVIVIPFVFPYVWLVNQVAEYHRLNGVLELLDVLRRAASEGELESWEK